MRLMTPVVFSAAATIPFHQSSSVRHQTSPLFFERPRSWKRLEFVLPSSLNLTSGINTQPSLLSRSAPGHGGCFRSGDFLRGGSNALYLEHTKSSGLIDAPARHLVIKPKGVHHGP